MNITDKPPLADATNPILLWWRDHVIATVEHVRVVERVHDEEGWDGRYAFMIMMSGGIAVLGLLLSSPAVVIGAMLISPLMGPIIGLGFGIAMFDAVEIRRTLSALGLGIILAVLFCALIVLLSPLQNVTEEVAARTRPNLFDLMVALFSALAGAYAMIRGREGTIVGVAIATSLMPPLGAVGFGLATLNGTVFFGASALFFTNLMTVALGAAVMARIYGFGPRLSPRQTALQTVAMLGVFLALAIPLGIALSQIAWEARTSRVARDVIAGQFGEQARLSQIAIDYDAEPIGVSAEVLTPAYLAGAEREIEIMLGRLLGEPVALTLRQFRVGTGQAEAAALAAAQNDSADAATRRETARIVNQLALVAGVAPEAVMIDSERQRAVVTATPLPGAPLQVYRALEERVAKIDDNWAITLAPPPAPLPDVSFGEEGPDSAGEEAIATAIWGARRLNVPIGVAGADARVEQVLALFAAAEVRAEAVDGAGADDGSVRLVWLAPALDEPSAP